MRGCLGDEVSLGFQNGIGRSSSRFWNTVYRREGKAWELAPARTDVDTYIVTQWNVNRLEPQSPQSLCLWTGSFNPLELMPLPL